jgi:hypothetical protein
LSEKPERSIQQILNWTFTTSWEVGRHESLQLGEERDWRSSWQAKNSALTKSEWEERQSRKTLSKRTNN